MTMRTSSKNALLELVAKTTRKRVPADIKAIALAARTKHGACVEAVLGYGSCLRGVSTQDSLVDLYVLVSHYKEAHTHQLSAYLNRLIPPNVYYLEIPFKGRTIRCKYALVSLDQFERRVSDKQSNPYFWARFCQPTAILFAKSASVQHRVHRCLATAITTSLDLAPPLCPHPMNVEDLWVNLFQKTYGTELRSESLERAREIFLQNKTYYTQAATAWFGKNLNKIIEPQIEQRREARSQWKMRALSGKALSVLRLIKASFTFTGGAEYISWKINRHSGVKVELNEWQKKHPLLAAIILVPKLYFKGAFR